MLPPLCNCASPERGLPLHCMAFSAPPGRGSPCAQLGEFGGDNRAGIDRTLHRISCLRNRDGRVIGLTCRAGRAVCGSAALAADIVAQGRSLLLLVRDQCCLSQPEPARMHLIGGVCWFAYTVCGVVGQCSATCICVT